MRQWLSRISRRTWIIIGVIAFILLVIIIGRGRGNKSASVYQTESLKRGTLVASVGATGTVRARQSAVLRWLTTGVVAQVNADVGTQVGRGEVLAVLDLQSLSQSIILAQADLATSQKALDDLLNSDTTRAQAARTVSAAEDAYKKAYDYRKQLNGKINISETYLDHGIPKVRYTKGYADADTIRTADEKLALAQAQLDDARRAYDRVKNGVDSADVAAAKARVAAAEATLSEAAIISPFQGTVTQNTAIVGDQVNAGDLAFRVDDVSHLLVDLQVSEVDINSIQLDQPATLTFDAVLGHVYHGKVVQAGQAGDSVQGVVNFTVSVELTDADELVKPGMTAAVSIVVQQQNDVLLIPNRAVRVVNSERVVYVMRNGKPAAVKITLGASSDQYSALASGELKEGDPIVLNPPSPNGGPFGG